jgi:N-acetylmuramoyl-L-alanine amidase
VEKGFRPFSTAPMQLHYALNTPMMTTIFSVVQTMLLSFLPFAPQEFNISLPSEECRITNMLSEDASKAVFPYQEASVPSFVGSATQIGSDSLIKETANIQKELDKNEYQLKTVVIDAGHGGHDPGCLGSGSREKHLALGIAQKLAKYLNEEYPELRVILTRDKDIFIPLYERARIANRNNADLFISIHCNFFPSSNKVRGTETYVMGLHTAEHNLEVAKRENSAILLEVDYEKNYNYDPNSPEGHIMLSMFQNAYLDQSILFAEMVEKKFAEQAERKSRGVHQAGFVVLKETLMPSVLIEAGFLSNYNEEQFLKSKDGQATIAQAIGKAFGDYKKLVETQVVTQDLSPQIPVIAQTEQTTAPATVSQPAATNPGLIIPKGNNGMKGQLIMSETQMNTLKQFPDEWGARPVKVRELENKAKPTDAQPELAAFQPSIPEEIRTADPLAKEPASEKQPDVHSGEGKDTYQFFVQLAAATHPIDTKKGVWKNIDYQLEVVIEGRLLKYRARTTNNLDQAMEDRDQLRKAGFPDAFLIAYKNGEKIPIEQVKK